VSSVFDLDVELDFPDRIRRRLGLPLRNPSKPKLGVVGADGLSFGSLDNYFIPSDKYLLLEHKEIETIWENSHYARENAIKQLDDILQKHLDVARILQPYGCMGFAYSTNEKELARLLAERIHALGEKGSVRLIVRTL
jgi:hypothetical protein